MRISKLLIVRLVGSAIVVAAALISVERQRASSERLALEIVAAEAVDAERNVHVLLEGARLTLDGLLRHVHAVGGGLAIDPQLDAALDLALLGNPFVVGAVVQDSSGRIVAAGAPRTAIGADGSGYPAFRAFSSGVIAGYFVGAPIYSSVFKKDLLSVARAIPTPSGDLAAVVTVGIDVAALKAAMRPNMPRVNAIARLWRTDGVLLASSSDDGVATGVAYPQLPLFAHWNSVEVSGSFVADSPLTGTHRLTAWFNNPSFPVFAVVVAEHDDMLRSFRAGAAETALVAGLLLLLLWITAYLSDRESARRQALLRQAEASRDAAIAAKREAEIANSTKTRLLANLSHEFRTPLNAILGFTEMVRLGYKGAIPPSAGESLDLALGSARHLNELVGSLLEISRLELDPKALHLARGDVAAVIADAVAMVRAQADRRSVTLRALPGSIPAFEFDRLRVLQVLVNLLANAARHSPEGGTVTVATHVVPSGAEIRVEDSGPGIPAEFLEAVFVPFGNDALVARGPESLGLGLALSRQIARSHGGDIRLENRPQGGLAAILTLPLEGPPAAASTV